MAEKRKNSNSKYKKIKIKFKVKKGTKMYCGDSPKLPSIEYNRFGSRNECIQKGIFVGRNIEYTELRSKLKKYGVEIPKKRR
jgi:hypothetical protein